MAFLEFLKSIFLGPSTKPESKLFDTSEDLNVLDLVHIANALLIFSPYLQYAPQL